MGKVKYRYADGNKERLTHLRAIAKQAEDIAYGMSLELELQQHYRHRVQ